PHRGQSRACWQRPPTSGRSPGLRRPSVSSRAALRAREWATSGFVITFTHSDKRAPRIWLGLARNDHAAARVPSQRDGTLLTFGAAHSPPAHPWAASRLTTPTSG